MPPETGPRGAACVSSLRDGAAATGRDSLAGRGLRGDLRASDALTGAAAVASDAAGDSAAVPDAARGAFADFAVEANRGVLADAAAGAEAGPAPEAAPAAAAPDASDAAATRGADAPAGNGSGVKPAATEMG